MNKSWSSSRRTLPRWIVATARCVLLVSTWNLVTAPCLSQKNANAEPGNVYLLKERWSVAAQGPVHLREKRVTTECWIRVSNLNKDADGRPTLELRFERGEAKAEVPAQRREGRYDSRIAAETLAIEHHELVRPAAFAGQTLRLQFSPGTNLETVTGLDQVASRADGLYDDFLRGSEQDLNTREFVCQGLTVEELRRTWADVFLVGADDRLEVDAKMPRSGEAFLVACIPSESWMRRVGLPVRETVSTVRLGDGRREITKQASLAESSRIRTTIGGVGWSYEPTRLTREVTMLVRDDGRVDAMRRHQTAVLETTLSLGEDIPIRMTIQESVELRHQTP